MKYSVCLYFKFPPFVLLAVLHINHRCKKRIAVCGLWNGSDINAVDSLAQRKEIAFLQVI